MRLFSDTSPVIEGETKNNNNNKKKNIYNPALWLILILIRRVVEAGRLHISTSQGFFSTFAAQN